MFNGLSNGELKDITFLEVKSGDSKLNSNQRDLKTPTRELRFTWKNKDLEFQAWEMAHFRLLGDDRKLPYGTSMLDKVRTAPIFVNVTVLSGLLVSS